jgi:DnaK suppressor protein
MKKRVMEVIKRKLVQSMNEILETINKELSDEIAQIESDSVIGDIVDKANSILEMQIYDKLTEKEQEKLQEISDALKRIEDGVYGKCVVCGKPIEEKRLLAIPEAKMCIMCKSAQEKKKV